MVKRYLTSCGILITQSSKPPPLVPGSASHVPCHGFFNIAPALGSKKMQYSETRVLGYSAEQMYNVVVNVDKYHFFVPWCRDSKVISKRSGLTKAELEVGFPPVLERYVSEISTVPYHQVKAVCKECKMFNYLETVWQFGPGLPGQHQTCTLKFNVSFEFKSLLHSQLANLFFDDVVRQMVAAFEKQAAKMYGAPVPLLQEEEMCAAQCS
ncbi:coenzyme Q-binding protein COQ10 homolog B, mitochondrial-like isoform X2 [Protopterus annectens]|uniref:coenzyme Q-binding protein COQ10 homolog B, mitochondrial-like isoform X2 n=1 Tax=Protopterus annectens TaxID=7888 RepID=UPI001CFAB944|nr:coenzyme Q-binding protein COQ10 homolog B, mitochondrial-like isoform X2 [Protopterus annectens]